MKNIYKGIYESLINYALTNSEMICIKGGDPGQDPPVAPPTPPVKI